MDLKKILEQASQYLLEEERLNTFKNWIFSSEASCNVKKMAEAGFIFIGSKHEPDAVKCFFCNKHLDGWESNDDPWIEHMKHAPYCSFAKLNQSQDNMTLAQFIELRHEYLTNILDTYRDKKNSDLAHLIKKVENNFKK